MIIFIRTQEKRTAAGNFFNNLVDKCEIKYMIIEQKNKNLFSFFKLIFFLKNQIKDKNHKYTLINDFGFFKNIFIFYSLNLPFNKIKIYTSFYHHVFSLRECFVYFQFNELWKFISLKSYSFIFPYINKINFGFITVSKFTKNNMINNFSINKKKIIVLWNQILESDIHINSDFTRNNYQEESYILIISTLIARKNITLIKKISNIYGKKIKLVCPFPKNIKERKIINYLKENNVKIFHYLNKQNLYKFYIKSCCVLIPSLYEGLSLIPLEAIKFSKPIIMSNIEPHLHWHLPKKFYFDINNFSDILNKLKFYLNQGNSFVDYSNYKDFKDSLSSAQIERKQGLEIIYNKQN